MWSKLLSNVAIVILKLVKQIFYLLRLREHNLIFIFGKFEYQDNNVAWEHNKYLNSIMIFLLCTPNPLKTIVHAWLWILSQALEFNRKFPSIPCNMWRSYTKNLGNGSCQTIDSSFHLTWYHKLYEKNWKALFGYTPKGFILTWGWFAVTCEKEDDLAILNCLWQVDSSPMSLMLYGYGVHVSMCGRRGMIRSLFG